MLSPALQKMPYLEMEVDVIIVIIIAFSDNTAHIKVSCPFKLIKTALFIFILPSYAYYRLIYWC